MVLRIGPVPVWVAPSELVASARAVLGWTDDAVELVAALPERVTGLLDEIDGLLQRSPARCRTSSGWSARLTR